MACTIKDIAKDTGLSTATISKHLNGKKILPENARIIDESVRKFGYKPNKSAQHLRLSKSNTVCILIPDPLDYFWGGLCTKLEEFLQKYNYSTLIRTYNPQLNDSRSELMFLISRQVAGVFYIPQTSGGLELPSLLHEAKIPFVYLDQHYSKVQADCVTSTNEQSAYEAMSYLLCKGHRRIGVISGDKNSYTICERYNGCKRAFEAFNLPQNDLLFLSGAFSPASGSALFKEMMALSNPPSAIFMLGSNMTIGAILELNTLSMRIPEDFSLITFDDDEIFTAINPPISAIVQNFSEIARQGVELLIRRISGDYEGYPELRKVPTNFIERKSVRSV